MSAKVQRLASACKMDWPLSGTKQRIPRKAVRALAESGPWGTVSAVRGEILSWRRQIRIWRSAEARYHPYRYERLYQVSWLGQQLTRDLAHPSKPGHEVCCFQRQSLRQPTEPKKPYISVSYDEKIRPSRKGTNTISSSTKYKPNLQALIPIILARVVKLYTIRPTTIYTYALVHRGATYASQLRRPQG